MASNIGYDSDCYLYDILNIYLRSWANYVRRAHVCSFLSATLSRSRPCSAFPTDWPAIIVSIQLTSNH